MKIENNYTNLMNLIDIKFPGILKKELCSNKPIYLIKNHLELIKNHANIVIKHTDNNDQSKNRLYKINAYLKNNNLNLSEINPYLSILNQVEQKKGKQFEVIDQITIGFRKYDWKLDEINQDLFPKIRFDSKANKITFKKLNLKEQIQLRYILSTNWDYAKAQAQETHEGFYRVIEHFIGKVPLFTDSTITEFCNQRVYGESFITEQYLDNGKVQKVCFANLIKVNNNYTLETLSQQDIGINPSFLKNSVEEFEQYRKSIKPNL